MRVLYGSTPVATDNWYMLEKIASTAYVAAELKARSHRDNHEFAAAASSAHDAAAIALAEGDPAAGWAMKYFQAENLMDAGDFEKCADLARELIDHPHTGTGEQTQARAHILLSKAWQGSGLLESAAEAARTAAELTSDEADIEINVKARQALIAALADGGRLVEAWNESRVLASIISEDLDDQVAGKAYWVIGNVAFLSNRVGEGLRYHELAATTFSPSRNLDVWAKFNKASAAMRLTADVADTDTLRCIERAELATDVIGGTANDYLLLRLNRAHWNLLAGDPEGAAALLQDLCGTEDQLAPQRAGEACFLLGRAYLALGKKSLARDCLLRAASNFDASGAPHRAQQTRAFLRAELVRASFWSWLVHVTGFDRS